MIISIRSTHRPFAFVDPESHNFGSAIAAADRAGTPLGRGVFLILYEDRPRIEVFKMKEDLSQTDWTNWCAISRVTRGTEFVL